MAQLASAKDAGGLMQSRPETWLGANWPEFPELFSNVVGYRVSQAAFFLEPFLSTLRWALARS